MEKPSDAQDKGEWASTAEEGVVPVEDSSGDGPVGRTTGSDEPATDEGIDREAGDEADAVTDGGPELPDDAEPDLKDAGAASRPSDD